MAHRSLPPRSLVALVASAALGACATPLDERCVELAHVQTRWLPPLVDGTTAVDALEAKLGPPTQSFDGGASRVWVLMLVANTTEPDLATFTQGQPAWRIRSGAERSAYREQLDRDGVLATVPAAALADRRLWPVHREAEFHLVAAVDGRGVVTRHALLRVLP